MYYKIQFSDYIKYLLCILYIFTKLNTFQSTLIGNKFSSDLFKFANTEFFISLSYLTKITIPKGQTIIIPVYAIHHDPTIYPNPEVYDPERFTKKTIQSRDPMHFIPFGYGSRYCIGERLSTLQTKLTLITILRKYKVDVCQKTITLYIFHSNPIVSTSVKSIILKITKIC